MLFLFLFMAFIILVPIVNLCIAASRSSTYGAVLKIGHRGAAGLAPENTLQAIDSGLSNHVQYIEIDIRETRDSQLVVMHDKKVNRTTNGTGKIHTLTYNEINDLNASASFPGYINTRVPLLQEVLLKVKDSEAKLIIEIKDPHLYPQIVDKLVRAIKQTNTENKVAIFSFHKSVVFQVKKQLPGIETGIFCLGLDCPGDSADYISPNWISILYFPHLVNKIHKQGAKVLVWTPDSPFWMNYLCKMKVDGIITNRPDLLNSLLLTHSYP